MHIRLVSTALALPRAVCGRRLRQAKLKGRLISLRLLYNGVLSGAAKFTAEAMARNLVQLRVCMKVVAAPTTERVYWSHQPKLVEGPGKQACKEPRSVQRWCHGTDGGFLPALLA